MVIDVVTIQAGGGGLNYIVIKISLHDYRVLNPHTNLKLNTLLKQTQKTHTPSLTTLVIINTSKNMNRVFFGKGMGKPFWGATLQFHSEAMNCNAGTKRGAPTQTIFQI